MKPIPPVPDLRAPDLRALAPSVAAAVAAILEGIAELFAWGVLREPYRIDLVALLHRRLLRSARRFTRLMADFAADIVRRHGKSDHGSNRKKPPVPTHRGWLLTVLDHEVTAFRGLFIHVLAEPGIAELLAAVPTAQSILNPIRHALNLPVARTVPAKPRAPRPPRPEPAPDPFADRRLYPSGKAPPMWQTAPPDPRPGTPPPRRDLFKPA